MDMCTGCGACYAVCPRDAITMKITSDGVYKPSIDFSKCSGCKLCERVCPLFSFNRKHVKYGIGDFIHCYVGYSTNMFSRWKASSGGIVTTILLTLLEERVISGALDAIDTPKDPLRPSWKLVNSKEEVLNAMGSKYCPVKPSFKVKDLVKESGKIAVVGLPCHIWAFRRLEEIDRRLKDKVFIHIGLFCGKCPNFYATTYFLRKVVSVNEKDVIKISYRGKGWPGKITVITKQGDEFDVEFINWINFSYYPHFVPTRCVFCYDITNQLADISLGDAWGLARDNIGSSVIITRTSVGDSVIQHLRDAGKLALREVDPEQVSRGQGLERKAKNTLIRAYMWQRIFRKQLPYPLPRPPNFSVRDWVLNLGYCTWLYFAQSVSIRIAFCNLSPYLTRILALARRKV